MTLRLSRDSPLPSLPEEILAELLYAGPVGSNRRRDQHATDPRDSGERRFDHRAFGGDRDVEITVDDPGRYRVKLWRWERGLNGSGGRGIDTTPRVIIVTVPGDGSPVVADVAFTTDEPR